MAFVETLVIKRITEITNVLQQDGILPVTEMGSKLDVLTLGSVLLLG